MWSCLVWLWGESIRSRGLGESGYLLGREKDRGIARNKMGKKTKPVESQCSEWRRGALEAQHWFSSIYWVIMLLCSLKYSGGDWKGR